MNLFLNWLTGQKTGFFSTSEKLAIAIVFFVFCFVFNIVNIELADTSVLVADNVSSHADNIAGGSNFNKVYWSLLFFLALLTYLLKKSLLNYHVIPLAPVLILCVLLLVSVLWSDYPAITLRRAFLSIFVIFSVVVGVLYSRDRSVLLSVIYRVTNIALVLNFTVLLFGKGFAYTGEFFGIHGHKNTTGLLAVLAIWITLFYLNTRPVKASFKKHYIGLLLWLFILLLSVSKTSIALLVLCPIIWLSILSIHKALKINLLFSTLLLTLPLLVSLTLYLEIIGKDLTQWLSMYDVDVSLTGRDIIWRLVWGFIEDNPILGVGYGAFWDVGTDASNIGDTGDGRLYLSFLHQAHNGYLDVLLNIGTVGMLILLSIFYKIVKGIGYELRARSVVAHLAAILMLFVLIHNITETSFIRTTHAIWIMVLLVFTILSVSKKGRVS